MTIHFKDVPATFRMCPRTGSTSFKFWCYKNIPTAEILLDTTVGNGLRNLSIDEIHSKWENPGTTFGFVRNPYGRLVSVFHFIGQKAKHRLENKLESPYGTKEDDLKLFFLYQKGFANWIRTRPQIIKSPKDRTNMALFNDPGQTQMFCYNHVRPDLVVKLEELATDFVKIQELVGCEKRFTCRNSTIHTDYRDYYTDETRSIAEKLIEEDLDEFKYTF